MRAVVVSAAGGPEVLQVRELPDPRPTGSELCIEVHATALNRADLLQRRGLYPPPPGESEILGLECAGVVAEVGPDASPDWLGRRVMCLLGSGGYAERVTVPERMALPVPENVELVHAAAIPEAFLTANEALFEEARLEPREVVLVHAAAGGVGSAAVQLARAAGARVFATAGSPKKCSFVEALGAERSFDYTAQPLAEALEALLGTRAVAVVVDFVGAAHWDGNQRVLADQGRLVSVGVLGGSRVDLELGQLLRRRQRVLGMVMRSRSPFEKIALTKRFQRTGLSWFETGTLRPVVDHIFDLDQVAAAHRYMEQNQNLGKIVLQVR
jgi:putative PIG3 family NAD(P)H quinone oxidoreductase